MYQLEASFSGSVNTLLALHVLSPVEVTNETVATAEARYHGQIKIKELVTDYNFSRHDPNRLCERRLTVTLVKL